MRSIVHGVRAPERRGQTTLPRGRELAWAAWGPENGAPVLFCPGAGTSAELGFGADLLQGLGLRLISLDRPGLGRSSPDGSRTLLDWAQDVEDFAKLRGLGAPAMVAFSQGSPFALSCAAAGVVRAVAVVSGGDELAAPDVASALAPEVRELVEQVAADPAGAEAAFQKMSASMLHDMIVNMSSEVDRAVYTDPAFDAALRRALEQGFARGAHGYARDTLLAMSPWPFDLSSIAVPVDLWYGGHDTSPVHSPDLGASLARRIPTARRTVLEEAGGALLWTHAREILTRLLPPAAAPPVVAPR